MTQEIGAHEPTQSGRTLDSIRISRIFYESRVIESQWDTLRKAEKIYNVTFRTLHKLSNSRGHMELYGTRLGL